MCTIRSTCVRVRSRDQMATFYFPSHTRLVYIGAVTQQSRNANITVFVRFGVHTGVGRWTWSHQNRQILFIQYSNDPEVWIPKKKYILLFYRLRAPRPSRWRPLVISVLRVRRRRCEVHQIASRSTGKCDFYRFWGI